MTSGQTRASRSFLLTTSLGRDTSAIRMSSARAPRSTGTPSLVRSLSLATKLNGPNEIASLDCAVGVIVTSS